MTPDDQAAAPALLREVYAGVTAAVEPLAGRDLARPTRAARWDVAALLQHLLMDAQRALVALSTPRDDEATVDEVTYWRPFRPSSGDGGAAYADVVTALARAHPEAALVDAWRSTARAAAHAAACADPAARVETQGLVLAVPDLVSTLVVEATIHHLDLVVDLPASTPQPPVAALAWTRRILEGLYAAPLPPAWDDRECVLKATGRRDLDERDRTLLGGRTDGLPILG